LSTVGAPPGRAEIGSIHTEASKRFAGCEISENRQFS
jgi:hypothetical protein